jgi:hypothetical protein|tara:strand:+ start:3905 stop:4072 length:168 start_codon:yes stop_codon:yes gene_type:complete
VQLKVGDLVKYLHDTGIVLETMEDAATQGQALVLWQDGKKQWVACVMCEVISEGR